MAAIIRLPSHAGAVEVLLAAPRSLLQEGYLE